MDNKEIQYGITEIPPIEKPIKSIDKYWGYMDTLFETDDYSVKKIFMKKGSQSSLEYHVKKVESYYIDLDFDCDQDAQDFVYNDIYGYVTEPEVCLD